MFLKYGWDIDGCEVALRNWLMKGISQDMTQSDHIALGKTVRAALEIHWRDLQEKTILASSSNQ